MPLRQEDWSIEFEAVIILAALQDDISTMSSTETVRSPLLDWYRGGGKTPRASRVVTAVERAIGDGDAEIGFDQAVRRLELVSATLIEREPDTSALGS